jgi:putative transposase
MRRTIQTTYRYRLDPTAEQVNLLNQFAGARRFVWNWALGRKRDHFRQTGKTLSYNDLAAELTRLKQQPEMAWLREMDSQSLQQALRDLDSAYQRFFRRARNGDKKKGFPKFKSKKTDTPRFRIPQRVVLQDAFVSVPKIGLIKAIVHRPPHGVTKSATFKREACGHWYISLVTEQQITPTVDRPVQTHIGIDVGLKSLVVLSTGETIANPRWYRTQTRKLRRAQKTLSRKQKGSRNRAKARIVVARLHQKIGNQAVPPPPGSARSDRPECPAFPFPPGIESVIKRRECRRRVYVAAIAGCCARFSPGEQNDPWRATELLRELHSPLPGAPGLPDSALEKTP